MFKRIAVFVSLMFLAGAALAQGAPTPGVDYIELKPAQSTDAPGKVEVTEFFWYRCPHCYALEPVLDGWVKQLPRDAQFKRVPAVFNDDWAIDARIFYALDSIGEEERVHRPLFDAIHQQGGVRLRGEQYAKWVADWLSKNGVDMKKYDAAYNSFGVSSKVRRASQLTQGYKLDGVPALAVQGRYLINTSSGDRRVMLNVTDYLINEARKQLPKK
jgi:thiol:disulfide interchange protein DsbA